MILRGLMDSEKQRHDVFRMMVIGFSNGWVSGFYILGIGLLCLHLSHGASSMFQSLGWKKRGLPALFGQPGARDCSRGVCGLHSIPVAILLGYGR